MTEVVVTGIGLVTPIGVGTDAVWASVLEGRSGGGPLTTFDPGELPVRIACEARDFRAEDHLSRREISRTDRFTHMALAAAREAVTGAGWEDGPPCEPERAAAIVGTGIGGMRTLDEEMRALLDGGVRRVSPFTVPKMMPNGGAAAICMVHGLRGPAFAPASACASGAHAIGEACRLIGYGAADVAVAGGSESAITPLAMAAFSRMGALSTRNDDPQGASRPFDANRDGFVMGEGAALLVLERRDLAEARGAEVLARVAGYGASCDAHHVTQPDPEGHGAAVAMQAALADAGLQPGDVDHINAHGTSTPYNDRIETVAIKKVFGNEAKRIPVSSTKSQTGHLLGAAGAVEAGISVLALRHQTIPATINLTEPDPECDLDYVPGRPRAERLRTVMSNSFGFGGQNACLIFALP